MTTNRLIGLLVGTISLLPIQARAQPPLRTISDPLFLPVKGQLYGVTAYTLSEPQGNNFKGGAQTGSFKASNNLLDQTIEYGITRDLTVRAAMGYASNKRDSTSVVTGDVTTGNSHGFDDPTFSVTYRLLDEMRSPVILDVTGSLSPDMLHATSGGANQDGNVARGGSTGGFSLALGHEGRTFTIALSGGGTSVGREMTEVLSNGSSTMSGSHWNYELGLATQTRFAERVSLNAGVGYASTGSFGVDNSQKPNPRTSEGPNTRSFSAALNFHFAPNRVVGAITYTYDSFTDSRNVFVNPASDTAVANRHGNVIGARLMYLF